MENEPGYDDWKCTPPDEDDREFCNYPDCNCPFDMGPDHKCLIGLPREEKNGNL
jgi:hypothetical protein